MTEIESKTPVTQKRSASERDDHLEGIKVVLLDIEGTTTPISFVKDTLFKYVRENVKTYLEAHWDTDECQTDVKALREQAETDKTEKVEGVVDIPSAAESKEDSGAEDSKDSKDSKDDDKDNIVEAVVSNVLWQMDKERKTTGLKQLQGHIWREAYKTDKIQGKVYEDVVAALKQWKKDGKKTFVYSSGSVEAQKLLFGHSDKGDLQENINGYFDLDTGAKVEKDSYTKIAKQVEAEPEEVLFLTDIPAEAKAASEAGLKTVIVVREGNDKLSDDDKKAYNTVTLFSELAGEEAEAGEPEAKKSEKSEKSPEKKSEEKSEKK